MTNEEQEGLTDDLAFGEYLADETVPGIVVSLDEPRTSTGGATEVRVWRVHAGTESQFCRASDGWPPCGLWPVVSRGGGVCVLEGEIHQDGRLIAKATATALVRRTS